MNIPFKFLIIWYSLKIRMGRIIFELSPQLIQNMRWWKLKRKHLRHSSFYNTLVNSSTDLKDFPQIDKTIFMEEFNQINTHGVTLEEASKVLMKSEEDRDFTPEINQVTLGLSSGTSGNIGIFMASKKERAIWVAAVLNRVIGWSLKHRKVAFFLRANSNLYESIGSRILSFNYFDILKPMEVHIETLNALQPDIVVGQPSLLKLLAQSKERGELLVDPNKIISVAEVLTIDDKVYLEDVFHQKIHQVYQCTEGFLAYTCKVGTLHLNEDFIHFEKHYVDKKRFNPIVTDLLRGTQPVIRYLLNDILIEGDKCSCGSSMMTIESIEGRMDDVFIIETTLGNMRNLFPDILRRKIVGANKEINEYQIIQISSNEISLLIKPEEYYQDAESSLHELFKKMDLINIIITKTRYIYHENGSKFRRVIRRC